VSRKNVVVRVDSNVRDFFCLVIVRTIVMLLLVGVMVEKCCLDLS
jgi:hypothetical protein